MKGKEIRILTLLGIDTVFFFLEIIVGYAVHSLALVADSFHMLNDIFSLLVALWAVKVAQSRGVDSKYTYGWQRAEILGALINGVFLVALCMSIFLEAIQRFVDPPVITNPVLILGVGTAGLVSNIVGLVLFHDHGHSHGGSGGHSHSHGSATVPIIDEEAIEDETASVASPLPQTQVTETSRLLSGEQATSDQSNYNTEPTTNGVTTANGVTFAEGTQPSSNGNGGSSFGAVNGHRRKFSETHVNHYHAKPKLRAKRTRSLNMEGVFLHVLGDALGNIGVMATALFIWKTDYSWKYYMDPVISLVITCIIFSSAMPLCRNASSILLQGVPQSIDADEVKEDIASLPGVEDIHDLHIWILKEDLFIATLHVSVSISEQEFMNLSTKINACLYGHGIHSTTIQPEFVPKSSGSSLRSLGDSPRCLIGNKSCGGLQASRVEEA
ncbi:vacuolar zinc transporter Cot1p [Trichomonascus vanleenenianus]|uniref:cation diffusion facilitator family transporter n=1 Tax=Trichomonascus vanleenenianus TaxID=2268995 RepID=UPI003ECABDB8